MAPSDRLKPVRRVAQNREQAAAKLLGDARRIVQEQESKLEQLLFFQQEYQQRFETACRTGISAGQLQDFQAFLAKLRKAIDQQRCAVEESRRDSSERKQAWQQKHTRTQAISKAIERFRKDELRAREKKEQKDSDEHSLRSAHSKA